MAMQGIERPGGASRAGRGRGPQAQGAQGADEAGEGGPPQSGDGRDAGAMRDQHMPGMMKQWSAGLDGGCHGQGGGGGGPDGGGDAASPVSRAGSAGGARSGQPAGAPDAGGAPPGGDRNGGDTGGTGSSGAGANAAGVAGASGSAPSSAPSGGGSGNKALIDAINQVRRENGLSELTENTQLDSFAANNDAANQQFQGNDAQHLNKLPNNVGEVTAGNPGGESVESAIQQWLNSPGHRELLLSPDFTQVGASISGTSATADFS